MFNSLKKPCRVSCRALNVLIGSPITEGIIASIHEVGYFVKSTKVQTRHHIFLLFNEFSEFKEDLFNSFMEQAQNSEKDTYKASMDLPTTIFVQRPKGKSIVIVENPRTLNIRRSL